MGTLDIINERIKNGRCEVLGMGISNLPLIDYLISHGAAETVVRDKKDMSELPDYERFSAAGVKFVTGDGYLSDIGGEKVGQTVIFRSPGFRPDIPQIAVAVQNGAILSSEMELFFEKTPATIIGITGSDGKTTTTTLTYMFLQEQTKRHGKGHAYVGGNIGEPLLPKNSKMSADDFAVVELSSFQLQTMQKSPTRAAITNITPNHLNWHTDLNEYADAKFNICTHEGIKHATFNAENAWTYNAAIKRGGNMTLFSSKRDCYAEIVPENLRDTNTSAIFIKSGDIVYSDGQCEQIIMSISDIKLRGMHNVENYMTAISLTWGLVDHDIYREIAKSFGGVEHRLEYVGKYGGVDYYNSSIDSSPTRTAAALSALGNIRPVVICGGYDKNIEFKPLAEALVEYAGGVIITGATADKIEAALCSYDAYSPKTLPTVRKADFYDAVCAARDMAKSDGTVILSPACASFDAFKNFMERGDTFKKIVRGFNTDN